MVDPVETIPVVVVSHQNEAELRHPADRHLLGRAWSADRRCCRGWSADHHCPVAGKAKFLGHLVRQSVWTPIVAL